GHLKTCNLCHKKLGLSLANNNSCRVVSLVQANQNDLCENEFTYTANIDNSLLSDIIDMDNIKDYISTEIEACENSELGMKINLYINLSFSKSEDTSSIYKSIIEAVQNADGYNGKKQSQWYNCSLSSQHDCIISNPKHLCVKQPCFECQGLLKLSLSVDNSMMQLYLRHNILHSHSSAKNNIDKEISISENDEYSLLYSNNENKVYELVFITPFLQLLNSLYNEILIDATYKTNSAEFELYLIIANIEGVGYPLSYLFLNSPKDIPFTQNIELDHFQKMVDDLKYFVTDLNQELAKGNSRYLQAIQRNIPKTLKIAQEIKAYHNRISNISMWKNKE
ncbi:27793_t:CDS:2, partial [Dentiscutata erythropus]